MTSEKLLLENIRKYFNGDKSVGASGEWSYEEKSEPDGCFKGTVTVENKLQSVLFAVKILQDSILLQTACPISVREKVRNKMYEFISYINLGMTDGYFLLDPDDGELLYRSFTALGTAAQMQDTEFGSWLTGQFQKSVRLWMKFGDAFIRIIFNIAADDIKQLFYEYNAGSEAEN